jgi:hypothetical protein
MTITNRRIFIDILLLALALVASASFLYSAWGTCVTPMGKVFGSCLVALDIGIIIFTMLTPWHASSEAEAGDTAVLPVVDKV